MASKKEQAENYPATDDPTPKTAPEVPGFAVVSDRDEPDQEEEPAHEEKSTGEPEDGNTAEPDKNDEQEKEPAVHETTSQAANTPAKSKRSKKRIFFYALIVLINAAILTATVIYMRRPDKQAGVAHQQTQGAGDINADSTNTPEPPKNLHYVSDALKLEFDYPSDWRIESSPSNAFITIQSPKTDILQANGETSKGRVVMQIHAKYVDNFSQTPVTVDDATAIAYDSEKVVYKNPTTAQRKETHLTFSRSSNVGGPATGFDTIFVSGNLVYKKGAMARSQAYKTINPFIIIYVNPCLEDNCDTAYVPPRIQLETYQSMKTMTQVRDIIASARFN